MPNISYQTENKYIDSYGDVYYLLNTLIGYGLSRAIMMMMREGEKISEDLRSELIKKIDIDNFQIPDSWNLSVKKIEKDIEDTVNDTQLGDIFIGDIKKGNAGVNFTNCLVEEDTDGAKKVVKPWKNFTHQTYREVRNYDAYIRKNNKWKETPELLAGENLDFTNYYGENFKQDLEERLGLNLLMPQYNRVVQIEDLNRNFWVISQVLSGLSSFLFGPSKIGDILKELILEIAHLWSNVALLWLISEGEDDALFDTYYEFATLNNQGFMHMNYDSYNSQSLDDRIRDLFDAVKESHPRSHIVLLVEVRDKHYWENYYAQVSYKLCVFSRYDGHEWIVDLSFNKGDVTLGEDGTNEGILAENENGRLITEGNATHNYLRSTEFRKNSCAYRRDGDKYSFIYPFISLTNMKNDWDYMLNLRIVPSIELVNFVDINGVQTPQLKISFLIEDVGYEMYSGETSVIYKATTTNEVVLIEDSITLNLEKQDFTRINPNREKFFSKTGGYRGENLTCFFLNTLIALNFSVVELPMPGFTRTSIQHIDNNGNRAIPIELDFPNYINDNGNIFSSAQGVINRTKNFLTNVLKNYVDEEQESFQEALNEMPDELKVQLLDENQKLKTEDDALDVIIITCKYPYRLWHYNQDESYENIFYDYDEENNKIQKIKITHGGLKKRGNGRKEGEYVVYDGDIDNAGNVLNYAMSNLGYYLLICKKKKSTNGRYYYECAAIEDYYYIFTLPEELINYAGVYEDPVKLGIFRNEDPILFQSPDGKNWIIKWVRISGGLIGFQWRDKDFIWYGKNGLSTNGNNDSSRDAYVRNEGSVRVLQYNNDDDDITRVNLFKTFNDEVTEAYPDLVTEEKFSTNLTGQNKELKGIIGRVQTNYISFSMSEEDEEKVSWCARMQSRNTDLYERFYLDARVDSPNGMRDFGNYYEDQWQDVNNLLWAPGQSRYEYVDQCLNWSAGTLKKTSDEAGNYKDGGWRLFGTWYLKTGETMPGEENDNASAAFADMEAAIETDYVLMSKLPIYDYSVDPSTGITEG